MVRFEMHFGRQDRQSKLAEVCKKGRIKRWARLWVPLVSALQMQVGLRVQDQPGLQIPGQPGLHKETLLQGQKIISYIQNAMPLEPFYMKDCIFNRTRSYGTVLNFHCLYSDR